MVVRATQVQDLHGADYRPAAISAVQKPGSSTPGAANSATTAGRSTSWRRSPRRRHLGGPVRFVDQFQIETRLVGRRSPALRPRANQISMRSRSSRRWRCAARRPAPIGGRVAGFLEQFALRTRQRGLAGFELAGRELQHHARADSATGAPAPAGRHPSSGTIATPPQGASMNSRGGLRHRAGGCWSRGPRAAGRGNTVRSDACSAKCWSSSSRASVRSWQQP